MSIRAMNWAMEQATGDPRSQCLLYVIADCANPDGLAFPSIKYMASKSQQSKATVQRRMKELEDMGALARFPRWEDEDGKLNSEGRGRRTSDEIRLLMDVRITRISKPDDDDSESAESAAPPSQPDTPPSQPATGPVAQLSDGPPSHCGDPYMNRNLEPKKDSPPSPPPGGREQVDHVGEASEAAGETSTAEPIEGWEEFVTAFESDRRPIVRPSIAKTLFSALGADERQRVTRAAKGLIAHRAKDKKPGMKPSAQTFIREKDAWASWEKLAPPEPVPMTACTRGSEEFRAAAVYLMVACRRAATGEQISIATAKLAMPEIAALAQFADTQGIIDRTPWLRLDPGEAGDKARIAAWRERIQKWTGYWIDLESDPVLEPDGTPKVRFSEWNGEQLKFPVKREVLIVPCPWPPRKDGTISPDTTGPPVPALTQDDLDQLRTG